MKALFLDTATQFARYWHADSQRDEVQHQLEGRSLYCSRYVKCQYKAILLNAAIATYNLLVTFKDMKRALRESTSYQNREIAQLALTSAVQKRIEQIGLWMLEYCSYDEQKQRLEDLIEDIWETQFNCGVRQPLVDKTGCLYADGIPEMGVSGLYRPVKVSCIARDLPLCQIREFWDDHSAFLELLANMNIAALQAEPRDAPELERIKEVAQEVRSGRSAAGNCCTVYLSDAIICLESTHCPETVAVHSINKKHFRPLCEVFGIESEPRD